MCIIKYFTERKLLGFFLAGEMYVFETGVPGGPDHTGAGYVLLLLSVLV